MVILEKPQATVGQLVKDLEAIIKLHPEYHISFANVLDEIEYISGARFLENGLLLLESVSDPDDAIDVKSLLKKLKKIYPETKVVLQACGWMIINMASDPDINEDYNVDKDSFFYWSEEDDDEDASVLTPTEEDIRLFNWRRWAGELDRFAASNPNRIIYCLDEYGNAAAIRHCVDRGDYMEMIIDNRDSQPLTIADVIEKFETLNDFIYDSGVAVGFTTCKSYEEGVRTVKAGEDGNIFFETKIDGEDVVACRLGERVFVKASRDEVFVDPKDYDDPDDDSMDEVDDDDDSEEGTLAYFIKELRRFASEYPDRKVACQLDNGKYKYFNDMDEYEDELPAVVLSRYSNVGSDIYTVSDFLDTDPECFGNSLLLIKNAYGDGVCFLTIGESADGIFFKAKDGEEDIIAFRPRGVYEPEEDEEDWDEEEEFEDED